MKKLGLIKIRSGSLYQVIILGLVITSILLVPQLMLKQYQGIGNKHTISYRFIDTFQSAIFHSLYHSGKRDTAYVFKDSRISNFSIQIATRYWGTYTVSTIISSDSSQFNYSKTLLVNRPLSDLIPPPTLFISDQNFALSFGEHVDMEGLIYLPRDSERPPSDSDSVKISTSTPSIPAVNQEKIDSTSLLSLFENAEIRDDITAEGTFLQNGFNTRSQIVVLNEIDTLKAAKIEGNVILVSNRTVYLSPSCELKNCQLIAPAVCVLDGFKGSIHVNCRDSVIIGSDVELNNSSIVIYEAGENALHLNPQSQFEGNALLFNDSETLVPLTEIDSSSIFNGQLYVEGYIALAGNIKGSIIAKGVITEVENKIRSNFMDHLKLRDFWSGNTLYYHEI